MSGVNKIILVGRLGADPELKTFDGGNSVCRLSLATSENWTDKDGSKQERVEWHRLIVWGKLADICAQYLRKGRQIYAEGRIQTRSWEDNEGQKRYTTEIVAQTVQFLGDNKGDNKKDDAGDRPQDFGPEPSFDSSDEIPF